MATLAAVDIGANSVRLKIARVVRKRLQVLHEDREVVRLGEGVFRNGALDPAAMEQTVRVLRRFQKATQAHGATKVRVVATSALRDANNACRFRALGACRHRLARRSRQRRGRRPPHSSWGHGQHPHRRRTRAADRPRRRQLRTHRLRSKARSSTSTACRLGAVRLTREFLQHDPPTETELDQMRSYIGEEVGRVRRELTEHKINLTVATSGTPAALSELWAAAQPEHHRHRAACRTAPPYQEALRPQPSNSAAPFKGIGPRRAEIIVAGAHVFAELLTELDLTSFRYLPFGLRDGILAQMAADEEDIGLRKQLESERHNSILNLAAHYHVDLRFATRVAEHAQRLFKLLAPVHHLPPEYASLLQRRRHAP